MKKHKPISIQKQKYIEGVADGKSKAQAALDAGYSKSMAYSTSQIETPDVRAAFAAIMRKRVPADRIAKRISEGLNAKETKFFQQDGLVTDQRDVVAWSERRQYAALAADLGGYFVQPKPETIIPIEVKILVEYLD